MIANLDYIKKNIDIVEIIQNYLPLKKAGANYTTCCPFHDENTPSLIISRSKNIFTCFGCGVGGNGIDFIMKYERTDFNTATKKAASICNVETEETQQSKEQNLKKEAQDRLEEFYIESLRELKKQDRILKYLEKRGFKENVLQDFGIGYGISSEKIKEILGMKLAYNLGFITEKGYNLFQDRLLFCIRDEKNKIVGFSGRATQYEDDKKIPKYVNSKESFLYKKQYVLYNFTHAQKIMRRQELDYIYIVEGYFDALTCNLLELPAVAVGSANLSLNQFKLLTKLLKENEKIHIALDSDDAGRLGSIRAYKMLFSYGYVESKITRLDKKYKDINEFYKKADTPLIPFTHYEGIDYCLKVEIGLAKSIREKREVLSYYEKILAESTDVWTKNHINKYLSRYTTQNKTQATTQPQNNSMPTQQEENPEERYILIHLANDKQKRFIIKDILNNDDFSNKQAFNDIMQEKDSRILREYSLMECEELNLDIFYKICLRFKIYSYQDKLKQALKSNNLNFINALSLKLKELRNNLEIPF